MKKFVLLFLATSVFFSIAQNPGDIDTTLNPNPGPNNEIYELAIQDDGKIIITGSKYFTHYDGVPRNGIARINYDGTLDTTFNPGTGVDSTGSIGAGGGHGIIIQDDEKIIIAGGFKSYNGSSIFRIARLNTDGSLDTTFNPGTGATPYGTNDILLQSDGKIIIVGWFDHYNSIPRNHIARINTDGSLDTTFNPGSGSDLLLYAVSLQPDGKILIGGRFTSYNGTPINRIARLNSDGTLDTTFNPGTGCNNDVSGLALQCDGKIIINGLFTSYNGTPRNQLARINHDGSIDTTFNSGIGPDGYNTIFTTNVQCDGKIIIVGAFTAYNGDTVNGITRLNSDGSIDTTFNPKGMGPGTNFPYPIIDDIAFQQDGKAVIVGRFDYYNNVPRNRIVRIYDCEFSPLGYNIINSCTNYTWPVNNKTYTTSGVYDTVKTNAAGCTNVLKSLNLTINYPTNSSDTITACKNYTWNNNTYTQTGFFSDTILNNAGCDSIMSLNLTIADLGYSFSDTACLEYKWNNNLYNVSGTYADTFTNISGCDSIITVNLIINNVDTSVTQNDAVLTANADSSTYQWIDCNNDSSPITGETNKFFSASINGDYAVIIIKNGCADTSFCYNVTGIGINETGLLNSITVYPNPFTESTTFYFNDAKKASTLTIYNLLGFVVERKNIFSETTYTFNRKNIPSGVYFYKIEDVGAYIASGKIFAF